MNVEICCLIAPQGTIDDVCPQCCSSRLLLLLLLAAAAAYLSQNLTSSSINEVFVSNASAIFIGPSPSKI